MTTNVREEKEVRQRLIDEGFIDCIVQLPEKLFFTTGIPCCLFFISKNRNGYGEFRERKNEVLFIDARKIGSLVSRKQKALSKEDIERIANVYHLFKTKENEGNYDISGFCKVVSVDEVKEKEYKLSPGIYVGSEDSDEDEMPFEEKISILKQLLLEQFEESNRLQDKIKNDLERLL